MYPNQTKRKAGWSELMSVAAELTVYLLLWMVEKYPRSPLLLTTFSVTA